MSDRIRGQEVQVRVVSDGVLQKEIDEIKSMEFTYDTQIQSEGFLGRTTQEKDEIFNGINFSLEFQPRSLQALELMEVIRKRAQRRTAADANTVINITFVANFPNGDRPRLVIQDAKFQGPSMKTPGREQFVTVPLNGQASNAKYSPA